MRVSTSLVQATVKQATDSDAAQRIALPTLLTSIPSHMSTTSIQLQNASRYAEPVGVAVQLSQNVLWNYPNTPGPDYVILRNFSACVGSSLSISEICCPRVNGTFVTQSLVNSSGQISGADLQPLLDDRYPGQNRSIPANSPWVVGDVESTTESSIYNDDVYTWCSTPFNPLTSTPINMTFSRPGYEVDPRDNGFIPEGMQAWIDCFEEHITEGAIKRSEAAYVCRTMDVLTEGIVEGFSRYEAPSGGNRKTGNGGLKRVLGALVLGLGIWTVL